MAAYVMMHARAAKQVVHTEERMLSSRMRRSRTDSDMGTCEGVWRGGHVRPDCRPFVGGLQ